MIKLIEISKIVVFALLFFSSYSVNAASDIVAFLMPDQSSTRYEKDDFPSFKSAMNKLCPDCKVIYQNANADLALQQQQFNSVITQGAKVIILDPVDSSAAASLVSLGQSYGVKVIAYDRPVLYKAADFYVSFDNVGIGREIAESLVTHLEEKGVSKDFGGVLQINGSPTDAAAGLIRDGIDSGVDNSGYSTLAEYDTPGWTPSKAQVWTSSQVTRFGHKIIGVVAANDGIGAAAIAAFKAAGVDPLPPITGNDATKSALQLVISGDQYNTILKPSKIVAEAAAEVAVSFLKGETPEAEVMLFNTPSRLFKPKVITQDNIKELIFDSGIALAEDVCTGTYFQDCSELGIK